MDAVIIYGKLELYKFSENTRRLFRSYMGNRLQYISIGAATSYMRAVKSGVPQGTVLGSILYSIYTNELPEIVKRDNCEEESHSDKDNLFGCNCAKCGLIPYFTDDCTVVVANRDRTQNTEMLRENLDRMTDFLQSNGLASTSQT